jgi:hypothetical protein
MFFLIGASSAIQIAFVLLASSVLTTAQPPDAFIAERTRPLRPDREETRIQSQPSSPVNSTFCVNLLAPRCYLRIRKLRGHEALYLGVAELPEPVRRLAAPARSMVSTGDGGAKAFSLVCARECAYGVLERCARVNKRRELYGVLRDSRNSERSRIENVSFTWRRRH